MHIHILGICGTFMAGLAVLAKQQGHHVMGSDRYVYPPMSTQLEEQGITFMSGYDPAHLTPKPDYVIIGNALSRGNPAVEYILEQGIPYISGPQWLAENILQDRWVLAVAGTHGKTTTTSLLTWILEQAGLTPGFLIGGVSENFGLSARIGAHPYFVIEADEYDSAFFDKRSKFMHYHPRTLILNNLEFDHADIFPDLTAIQTQFHHLVRTVPGNGLIICAANDKNLIEVIRGGCWTAVTYFGDDGVAWRAKILSADASHFEVYYDGQLQGTVQWSLLGKHNVHNALAALAAAHHVGVPIETAIAALPYFRNVKRRLEIRGQARGITVYDDFAHHPTAIAATLAGLRGRVGEQRIIAVLELASNTMKRGVHRYTLAPALQEADQVLLARPKMGDWGIEQVAAEIPKPAKVYENVNEIIQALIPQLQNGDHVLIMSNAGFDGIHQKLLEALA